MSLFHYASFWAVTECAFLELTYVEVNLSGHMLPQYAPWAGYKTLAYLLGRETMESHANDAGLYPNDQELYGDLAGKSAARRPAHEVEL